MADDLPRPQTQTFRITLVNNANQTKKAPLLLNTDAPLSQLAAFARNKLKIKKPASYFVQKGEHVYEITNDQQKLVSLLDNDAIILVSSGEPYVGKLNVIAQNAPSPVALTPQANVTFLHRNSYVDEAAVAQLKATAAMPGMMACIGMPDLHAGNHYPIGAAFISSKVYPALIGGDIGCGMSLYKFASLAASDITGREEKLASKIVGIEGEWDGDKEAWIRERGVEKTGFENSLGTVGAGNHFAEVQVIHEIVELSLCEEMGFDAEAAYLLVHSGSRGLGQSILADYKNYSLSEGSEELSAYMKRHDQACDWAACNRELIAHRIFEALNAVSSHKMLDIWHNNVQEKQLSDGRKMFLHRKGAAPSDKGMIVIPGSRIHRHAGRQPGSERVLGGTWSRTRDDTHKGACKEQGQIHAQRSAF
jgi:release factor H-coupled RctB family protein